MGLTRRSSLMSETRRRRELQGSVGTIPRLASSLVRLVLCLRVGCRARMHASVGFSCYKSAPSHDARHDALMRASFRHGTSDGSVCDTHSCWWTSHLFGDATWAARNPWLLHQPAQTKAHGLGFAFLHFFFAIRECAQWTHIPQSFLYQVAPCHVWRQ